MAVGINLTDGVRVELGEIKEYLLQDLDNTDLTYDIAFDKVNKENMKETIIHIREINTEISINNDIVYYIKCGNTKYSHLDTIKDISENTMSHIQTIKDKINELFGVSKDYSIKIEKIDTKTLNTIVIVHSQYEKARVHVLRDAFGEVYINAIMAIQ